MIKRIVKNFFFLFLSRVYEALSSLITIALVARYLGKEAFGKYVFVIAFVQLFEVITDMGFNVILVRELAREKSKLQGMLGVSVIIKVLTFIVAFVTIFIAVQVFNLFIKLSPLVKSGIYIFALAVTIDFFVDITTSVSRAYEKMEYEAVINFLFKTTTLGFIALAVFLNLGFLSILWARLASNVCTAILSYAICIYKFGKPEFSFELEKGRYFIKESISLGIAEIINRFYEKIDIFLLQIMTNFSDVGFLGAALRIEDLLSLIPRTIVTIIFPKFSMLFKSSMNSLSFAYERTLKFIAILSLPLAAGIVLYAKQIVILILGPNFADAAIILQILGLSMVFSFPGHLFKFMLTAMDKQKIYRVVIAASLLVNLLLGIALIPFYGYVGASIAIFVSQTVFSLACFFYISQKLPSVQYKESILPPSISIILTVVFVYLLQEMSPIFLIPCSILIYILALTLLHTFKDDEISIMKRFIPLRIRRILRV